MDETPVEATEPTEAQPQETAQPAADETTVEAAFIVFRHKDGSYSATTDFTNIPAPERKANLYDIKQGCLEIVETIQLRAVRNVVASVVTENSLTDSDKVAQAMRQSLSEKGLL